jgi:hypothetical protein
MGGARRQTPASPSAVMAAMELNAAMTGKTPRQGLGEWTDRKPLQIRIHHHQQQHHQQQQQNRHCCHQRVRVRVRVRVTATATATLR